MSGIEDAAEAYVAALRRVELDADRGTSLGAVIDYDDARHRLVVAVGPCFLCDPGSCPYEGRGAWGARIADTPPL